MGILHKFFSSDSDPLYPAQSWAYEMINVIPIWEQNIFGRGVKVRINDNGVNGSHLEFLNRFDLAASCSSPDPDSNLDKMGSSHGTLVASIVAAAANNAECAVGIAPETTISSCNVFLETEENLSLTILSNKIELYDISQNSWGLPACSEREDIILRRKLQINICPFKATGPNRDGPCDICDFESQYLSFECEESIVKHCKYLYEQDISACLDFLDVLLGGLCVYDALPEPALDALKTGILEGRDGKGIIYVFASGNDFDIGDDVNFGGLTNSRFTISVGAVGKDSLHASYSTPGAALFLSGPGGDHESVTNQVGATADGGCADAGIGTSFACPVVSGVIALMLEANPDLTWRDVQGVLASTSKMVFKDPYDTSRVRNAAGIYHSNFYGFGIVDAEAAVKAAQSWDFYGPEKMLSGDSGEIDMLIQDDASALGTSVVSIDNSGNDFITESVVVLLDLDHFSRGDLEVTLTSPSNTASTLHPGKRLENTQLDVDERWKLMTVRAWGENAVGDWTLSIRDLRVGDATNCADAPFLAFFDNLQVTCDLMAYNEFCVNGSLNGLVANDLLTLQDNGRTIQTACCECGGGVSPTNISLSNELRQWRLVVYGREGIATRTPTDLPSSRPTERPVVQPSSVPSTTSPITTNAPSIVQSSLPALKTMQPQTQPLSSGSSSEAFALFSFSMFGVSCFGFLFGFLFGFF